MRLLALNLLWRPGVVSLAWGWPCWAAWPPRPRGGAPVVTARLQAVGTGVEYDGIQAVQQTFARRSRPHSLLVKAGG